MISMDTSPNPTNPELEAFIDSFRGKMKDYLVNVASQGTITLDEAKIVAQFTADHFPYSLATQEAFSGQIEEMAKKFPQHQAKIKTLYILCKLEAARKTVDTEVYKAIEVGNLDRALEIVKQFNFS